MVRVICQAVLGGLFGALAGALVSVVVAAAFGKLEVLYEGVFIGAILAGSLSAWMSVVDEDWSVLSLIWDLCCGRTDDVRSHTVLAPKSMTPPDKEESERAAATAPIAEKNPVVLFLCTGNSVRSQMAEAFLKKYAGNRFAVYSAGFRPTAIHPLTIRVMSEAGIDISSQYSKDLRQFLGKLPVRVAISVCAPVEPDCPTSWPTAVAYLSWPFEDPASYQGNEEDRLQKFRAVRDLLDQQIKKWLQDIGEGSPTNLN